MSHTRTPTGSVVRRKLNVSLDVPPCCGSCSLTLFRRLPRVPRKDDNALHIPATETREAPHPTRPGVLLHFFFAVVTAPSALHYVLLQKASLSRPHRKVAAVAAAAAVSVVVAAVSVAVTAVVAIGGNSLITDAEHRTVEDQYRAAGETDHHIAALIADGWNVVITHGNGPQIGFILRRSELARDELHEVPLDGGQVARSAFRLVSPTNGDRWALALSLIMAGAIVVLAISQGLIWLAVLFGVLAWSSIQGLQRPQAAVSSSDGAPLP